MQPESQQPAPAVVVVVVACDPGPWFEQVLASIAEQDYPNLSVLVLDAGGTVDPTPAVAAALPAAYVRRLEERCGFAAAANEVLTMVQGASHLLLCHDDVALAPDAVRLLVEEAFRSNAGIATPKYVRWDAPDRLVAVGATTDKVGALRELVEPGELDQEQHDAMREVLVAPGGATLIRADLFAALEGFDPAITQFGEDLDLSWRARVAGARIVTVPAARVRHRQAVRQGERPGWGSVAAQKNRERIEESNRIRTLTTCYRWFDLLWALPLALFWVIGEAATLAVRGRPGDGWRTLASYFQAFRQPGELWKTRRHTQHRRRTGDAVIRRLQVKGNIRLRTALRARFGDVWEGQVRPTGYEEDDETEPAPVTAPQATRSWRVPALIGAAVLFVLMFGMRNLLGHDLPAVGTIPRMTGGWSGLWRSWWSQWQPSGLGVAAPASPALGVLGVLGTALFGATGTLQHVVVLGAMLAGPIGAYRAARWWGSRRGQLVATVAYAVVPLPYNALAQGHWYALVAYGAAPWIISAVGRLPGEVPYPPTVLRRVWPRILGLALLVAAVASVAPAFLYVVPIIGVALLIGSFLAGRPGPGARMLAVSALATAAAFVLLLPWSATVVGSRAATLGPGLGSAGRLGFGALLRFHTGPIGSGWIGWAFLVAAALPLFIGRDWRLAWAARLWSVAVVLVVVAWAGRRGWMPAIPVELLLAPAAAALAGCTALGAASFELDLPGYRFGWRQLAAGVAGLALAGAAIPIIIGSGGGRWEMPTSDAASTLSVLKGNQKGDFRILWVGAPSALPMASRQLYPGMAYATSYDGTPGLTDMWTPGSTGAVGQLAYDLSMTENGLTTKLGHLLAPAAVRYLVIPNNTAPTGAGGHPVAVPSALLAGLGLQTDLQSVYVGDPDYSVYENAAWVPARTILPAGTTVAAAGGRASIARSVQQMNMSTATPVLTGGSADSVRGRVPAGSLLYVSATRSLRWRLDARGSSVRPTSAFASTMSFRVPTSTAGTVEARLSYHPSGWLELAQWVEILLCLAVVAVVVVDTRRRRLAASNREIVDPGWFVPMAPAVSRPRRRVSTGRDGYGDLAGDEVWSDV
jgi:GT2 family glycosyltransferase